MFWDHEDGEWCCWLAPSELQGWHPPLQRGGCQPTLRKVRVKTSIWCGEFSLGWRPMGINIHGVASTCLPHTQTAPKNPSNFLSPMTFDCIGWNLWPLPPFIWAHIKIRFPWFSGSSFSRRDSGPNIRCVPLSMCWRFTLPLASPSGGAQASITADSFPHPFIRHFFISLPFSWSMLSVAAQSCLFPVFAKIKRGCLCGCMWCSLKLKDPLWSFLHIFRPHFFSHWHFAPRISWKLSLIRSTETSCVSHKQIGCFFCRLTPPQLIDPLPS